jgi:1,4-alpha-glucan branching enzyme
VRLAGDFNNWNPTGYTLAHEGNEWRISMRLKPGKYRYKFVAGGRWILDPGNKQREQNEYGTGNSVLWIPN